MCQLIAAIFDSHGLVISSYLGRYSSKCIARNVVYTVDAV